MQGYKLRIQKLVCDSIHQIQAQHYISEVGIWKKEARFWQFNLAITVFFVFFKFCSKLL